MKRIILFIVTIVMLMAFTGCSTSKEVPTLSESVETEVLEDATTELESNEESKENVPATEEVIENNSTSNVDSTGSDVTIDEGDYIEPSVNENTSEVADAMEQAKKDMQEFYEAGLISEEDYKAAMETLEKGPQTGVNIGSEYTPSASDEALIQEYAERSAEYMKEHETTGQGDQRTDIDFSGPASAELSQYSMN